MNADQDRELRPAGRYEWEQIIRRSRLGAVVAGSGRLGKNGKPTKGGMSGTTFTGIALGWASYANDRGREVWPGDATVAVDLETSIAAVRQVRKALLRLGLLEFVARRHGARGDEYRLTIPTDLLDVVEVLSPAQHKLAANRLRDAARGKPGWSAGLPEDDSLGGPPDHPDVEPGGSNGPPEIEPGWSGGTSPGGPADTHTDHDRTTSTTTDHSETDLRTAVTVPSDPTPDQQPDFPDELAAPVLRLVTPERPHVGSRRWSSRGMDAIAEATARRAAARAAHQQNAGEAS